MIAIISIIALGPIEMALVPDDDEDRGQHNSDDEEREPYRAQTPPTPPVQHEPSGSPLPFPRPMRQRSLSKILSCYALLKLCALYSLYTLSSLFSIARQVRRHIVHTLVGGGDQHRGFDALD